jgi:hypothetical protein
VATNPDFRDLFVALSDAGAEYLVVGAHAVMFYTEPRSTKDIDVWVRPDADNGARVYRALAAFGAPLYDVTPDDFSVPGTIFQIGVAPNRIDVITSIDAVDFEEAWSTRVATAYGGAPIHLLSRDLLLRNKKAVNRLQDQLDVERLERIDT